MSMASPAMTRRKAVGSPGVGGAAEAVSVGRGARAPPAGGFTAFHGRARRPVRNGEDLADPRISGMVNVANGGPCPRRLIAGIDRLARRVRASQRLVAMIVGPKNSGRRAA